MVLTGVLDIKEPNIEQDHDFDTTLDARAVVSVFQLYNHRVRSVCILEVKNSHPTLSA